MKKRSPFEFEFRLAKQGRLFVRDASMEEAREWVSVILPADSEHNNPVERLFSKKGFIWLGVAGLGLFGVLLWQLFNLQILQGERYLAIANGNRVREQVMYAPRGAIYDRNGQVLASNTASFQLAVYPHLLSKDSKVRQAEYREVAQVLEIDTTELKKLAEAQGLEWVQPLVIKKDVPYKKALILEQRMPQLSGFSLQEVPARQYVEGAALSHLLGYVGPATESDLQENQSLYSIDFLGKEGVELSYDSRLRGQNGFIKTEVDAMGKPVRDLGYQNSIRGEDVKLTIDYGLQLKFKQAVEKQMKKAGVRRAAGVAVNPKTGEVLASVSLPAYNNNLFTGGISSSDYQELVNNPLQPLYNKVIAGGYPSGSIIKPLHATAILQEGVVDEETIIHDNGKLVLQSPYGGSFTFYGWDPSGLGPMNVRRAIAMSSNIYFFTTGGGYKEFEGLGADKLTDYYRLYGLGSRTGIDLPGETEGRVPTPAWKEEVKGEQWFQGDTYNISIGQGDLLVSPLQMATAISAIANNGKLIEPYVVSNGKNAPIVKRELPVNKKYLKVAREGMAQVIGSTTCTCTFANVGIKVAGKSGTAETNTPGNRNPHAWYTAFAPYEDPEIAFALILEEGEGGSQFAAPAIAEAMEYWAKSR